MPYEKHTWLRGETITAENLNHLEDGIVGEQTTRASQDQLINERIDQVIAPTGEAPNPSEITDARIGEDGTVYNTLGTAIRTQVGDLKNALEYTAKNVIQEPTTKNIYSGMNEAIGHILTNGQLVANASFNTTDYIDVSEYESVVASSGRDNVEYPRGDLKFPRLTTYDANKTVLSYNNAYNSTVYTVGPGVVYIRFSYEPAIAYDIMVESGTTRTIPYVPYEYETVLKNSPYAKTSELNNVIDDVKQIESDLTDTVKKINAEQLSFVSDGEVVSFTPQTDGYIKANGELATSTGNNYFCSGYVSVEEYKQYAISASANYNHALYAFYANDHTVVEIGMLDTSAVPTTKIDNYVVTAPKNASYIAIAYIGTGNGKIYTVEKYNFLYKKWKDKTWVCIGDSLTEVNERTTMHYHDYIAENTGITVINMGKSGTGYAKTYTTSGGTTYENFMDRALTIPADCDVLTIFGSGNDGSLNMPIGVYTDSDHTSGTLAGYVNETIDNLYSVNPLLNLGIVSPTPWQNENPMNENCFMYKYSAMLKSICEHRSIPYLDLYHCSNLRPWDATFRQLAYSKDGGNGTHPDENGHALISPRFEWFLDSLLLH